jgi:hypothetical protein
MSQPQITYKIKLQGSDGKEYVETFDGLSKDLNIQGKFNYLETQIQERRQEVEMMASLLKPMLIAQIKPLMEEYLKEWKDKSFHEFEFCVNYNNAKNIPLELKRITWDVFNQLVVEGKILMKKHGWFKSGLLDIVKSEEKTQC